MVPNLNEQKHLRQISGCIDRQKNELEIWRDKFFLANDSFIKNRAGVLIQKRLGSIVSCISTYNNSLKLSTHAIVIIFIIQEIVSRNQVRFTFYFLKKQDFEKSKTANLIKKEIKTKQEYITNQDQKLYT